MSVSLEFKDLKFFYDSGETKLFLPQELMVIPVVNDKGICISGKELLKNFSFCKLGIFQAEYLVEHQNLIPSEWKKFNFPFIGAIYEHKRFSRQFWTPYLVFDEIRKEWVVSFHLIDYYFFNEDAILAPII